MVLIKRQKLLQAGFRIGTVREFLHLSDEEAALIEMKVRLVGMLRSKRKSSGVGQTELARRMGSSQSRIAKIEAGDPNVSLDLICKALLCLNVSSQTIGKTLASRRAA